MCSLAGVMYGYRLISSHLELNTTSDLMTPPRVLTNAIILMLCIVTIVVYAVAVSLKLPRSGIASKLFTT